MSVLSAISYLITKGLHLLDHSWESQLSKREIYKQFLDLEHRGQISRLQTLIYTQVFVIGIYFFARLGHLLKIEAYHLDKGLVGLFFVGALSIAIRDTYLIVKKQFGEEFYALGDSHTGEITLCRYSTKFSSRFYK